MSCTSWDLLFGSSVLQLPRENHWNPLAIRIYLRFCDVLAGWTYENALRISHGPRTRHGGFHRMASRTLRTSNPVLPSKNGDNQVNLDGLFIAICIFCSQSGNLHQCNTDPQDVAWRRRMMSHLMQYTVANTQFQETSKRCYRDIVPE
jgi:hypothetical protein